MANTNDLKLIHTITGIEFLAELTSQDDKTITVKNPVRIVVIPTSDPNNPKIAFGPYTQWTDDKVLTINRDHVTYIASPINEFVNQYNGMFGGLVVPPEAKIIKP